MKYDTVKDIISDILGLVIWVVTTILIWNTKMSFLWEGVAGYALGAIFFIVPDAGIGKVLLKVIQSLIKKLGG